MLKRTTATTNSNTQSSQSQCIINIIATQKTFDGKVEIVLNGPVLSIVDLAGAEKSQETGNQGTRLLESNFINNTSMVFGQCLRVEVSDECSPVKDLKLEDHQVSSALTQSVNQEFKAFPGKENDGNYIENLKHVEVKDKSPNQDIAGLGLSVWLASSPHSKLLSVGDKCLPIKQKTARAEEAVSETLAHNITKSEQEFCSPLKSVNMQKPRRRLLPASSLLLKE
ncbi:hypothetical protein MKX01_037223 [Papaver californicum]|nr:hypothetical protein MKX01_037223 [Papaver californicum]